MELRRALVTLGIVLGLSLGGCATTRGLLHEGGAQQTWNLNTSPRVPAATGQVSVQPGNDGNQTVDINVQRLAAPDRVFNGASTYVVWLIAPNSPPTNVGVLPLDQDLKGRLQTKTPFKSFDVEVTAEPTALVTRPSANNRVMSASVRLPS
jgi:hypothetical protein